MFERNRIDNVPDSSVVPVEITLASTVLAKGKLFVPAGKTISDVLNGPGAFIEFEPYGGEKRFLAKAQIVSLKPVGVPKGQCLKQRMRGQDEFDPHQILGLALGAAWEDVRQAYYRLSKTYHPDRYASALLPEEVTEYLSVMVRRVNAAYDALEPVEPVAKPARGKCSTRVYTSQPRA